MAGEFKNCIQVAGIIDLTEAEMIIGCGATHLGYPLRLPVNKEDCSEETAADIMQSVKMKTRNVAITYLNTADEILAFCKKLDVAIIQLHGAISVEELRRIKSLNPSLKIIKSLVFKKNNFAELEQLVDSLEQFVDAFITDTFDPNTGASGATGKTHDWKLSGELVQLAKKPVILAGGLTPENVYEAILTVKPAGVDTHTGVEAGDGRKDKAKVSHFVNEAKRAFEKLGR